MTFAQAGMVTTIGAARPGAGLSLALLTVMAFLNGWRSMIASGIGMESAPDDKVTVMSMRAAANQFGYLLGALVHLAPRMTGRPSAVAQPPEACS